MCKTDGENNFEEGASAGSRRAPYSRFPQAEPRDLHEFWCGAIYDSRERGDWMPRVRFIHEIFIFDRLGVRFP